MYITVARGLPELAKTLERLNCFHSEYKRGYPRASFELITRRVSVTTVEVRLTQITGDRLFLRTSALSIHVSSSIWTFYKKNKACLQKHRQLNWCFSLL